METITTDRPALAIDCAVGKGSVGILRGEQLVSSSSQIGELPSRAEEVLIIVNRCLKRAQTSLSELNRIVVSVGPGSYSGIRIGMSTALGLAKASSTRVVGVSVLDALTLDAEMSGDVITAVEVGKRHTAWCSYQVGSGSLARVASHPSLVSDEDFLAQLLDSPGIRLIWSADLSARLASRIDGRVSASVHELPIAQLLGRFAEHFPDRTSLTPLYLRDQQRAG